MRCANPKCQTESDYLRSGSLYQVADASPVRHDRFIWLCGRCTPQFMVETWRPPGEQLRSVILLPRRESKTTPPAHPLPA